MAFSQGCGRLTGRCLHAFLAQPREQSPLPGAGQKSRAPLSPAPPPGALAAPRRIQSLFNALGDEVHGQTIGLGGDGRYFNKEAAQIIIKLAAGNGVKKVSEGLGPRSIIRT